MFSGEAKKGKFSDRMNNYSRFIGEWRVFESLDGKHAMALPAEIVELPGYRIIQRRPTVAEINKGLRWIVKKPRKVAFRSSTRKTTSSDSGTALKMNHESPSLGAWQESLMRNADRKREPRIVQAGRPGSNRRK